MLGLSTHIPVLLKCDLWSEIAIVMVKEWSHPFQTPGWISHWVVQPMAGWAVRPMAGRCVGEPRLLILGSCRSAIELHPRFSAEFYASPWPASNELCLASVKRSAWVEIADCYWHGFAQYPVDRSCLMPK